MPPSCILFEQILTTRARPTLEQGSVCCQTSSTGTKCHTPQFNTLCVYIHANQHTYAHSRPAKVNILYTHIQAVRPAHVNTYTHKQTSPRQHTYTSRPTPIQADLPTGRSTYKYIYASTSRPAQVNIHTYIIYKLTCPGQNTYLHHTSRPAQVNIMM
jgi:hypothetical protein